MRELKLVPSASAGPVPEAPAADVSAWLPAGDDFDLDAGFARLIADIDTGRCRVPGERELDGPSVSLSLGDATDLDPALLAAMCGPDGLGGEALSAAFGEDKAADVLRPGPVLSALTEQAVSDLEALSDDQLTGALSAARRLENRAAYLQTVVIAEFARRREVEREEAKTRKVPLHCRPGQFPADELASELVCSARYADERIWQATDLATRLPRTLAGMASGRIDSARAYVIWLYTRSLTSQDAAHADSILAAAAPGLRTDQLGRKAEALEKKLDPEAVRRRRERARRDGQRVEVKHERSGNAVLAGRELDPVTALAAKANIDALAVKLRNACGEGSLQHLRAWVMTELLQGRDPLNQLTAAQAAEPAAPGTGSPADRTADDPPAWRDDSGYRDEEQAPESPEFTVDPACGSPDEEEPPTPLHRARSGLAPLPALINVLVPAGTLLGWSTTPARVGNWGLLDADETKAFTEAAARSPRTRFCVTIVAPDGTALAHGCARGQHPGLLNNLEPQPPPAQLADLIRRLNITFRPIARGRCDHADAEDHYAPSRALKHLIRARTASCTAPACGAQAICCDLDHTVAYPDGPTCQCNLAPKCRHHHRCKQSVGWKVEQPAPGLIRWTVPSGRSYTTIPTVYDL